MTRTLETIRQNADLFEATCRTTKTILVESKTDEGEWIATGFANEAAAREYERKWTRQGVEHRRAGA